MLIPAISIEAFDELAKLHAENERLNAAIENEALISRDALAENERLRAAAKKVCWFDWSENDADAVDAIEQLRAALDDQGKE